ncbi:hypothetical protein [Streptomyces sp. NPDC048191]|uniref:hypothetical protein n=1 Tax=Streptomyces sp. NPDC048191 TaxID=3155484 RepID=UPI0033FEA77C
MGTVFCECLDPRSANTGLLGDGLCRQMAAAHRLLDQSCKVVHLLFPVRSAT